MKRFVFSVLICVLFFLFPCSVYADEVKYSFEWPPPAYDMPRVVINSDEVENVFSGLKISYGSIANVGLKMFGKLKAITLIPSVFIFVICSKLNVLKGVRQNEFRRKVNSLDREKNREDIINEKVAMMEINMEAKKRFRNKNPYVDLEEKIYQREIAYMATLDYREKYPDLDVDDNVYRRKVAAKGFRRYMSGE